MKTLINRLAHKLRNWGDNPPAEVYCRLARVVRAKHGKPARTEYLAADKSWTADIDSALPVPRAAAVILCDVLNSLGDGQDSVSISESYDVSRRGNLASLPPKKGGVK